MKRIIAAVAVGLFGASAFSQVLVDIPLDQQINIGQGDAIYTLNPATDVLSFQNEGGEGFARVGIGGGSWFYGPYVDLIKAGVGPMNISNPETMMSLDLRVFQASTNSNPYGDANAFLRMYTYAADNATLLGYRDYGIIYGPNMKDDPNKYPVWLNTVIPLNNNSLKPFTDTNSFDVTNVTRIRFYGTDWTGVGDDYLDAKDLKVEVVPEPATLTVLGLGALALMRRRKKA